MRELARLPAYLADDTGYWRRMPLVAGAFMCIFGTLNIWLTIGSVLEPREIIGRGLAGGVLFALIFTVLFRFLLKWSLRRSFRRAAPDGTLCRLICSMRKSPRMTIPGALHFSDKAASFDAHSPKAIGREVQFPLAELNVVAEPIARGWLMRLLTARDPVAMRLATASQSEVFIVPTPHATIAEVSSMVKEILGKTNR
jgi:hypothetical protein